MSEQTSQLDKLKRLHKGITHLHQTTLGELSTLLDHARKLGRPDLSELTDIGYLCREMENMLDDMRKECVARKELVGKIIAVQLTEMSIETPDQPSSRSDGELAFALPDMKMMVAKPKPGTPEYHAFCEHFGIPMNAREGGLWQPSFKILRDKITELAAEGEEMPPGLSNPYPVFSCSFRKRTKKS